MFRERWCKHDMFKRSQWAESRKWGGQMCCWFESDQPEQKYSVLSETVLGQSQPGKHTQVDQSPAHVVMQTLYILVTYNHIKTTLTPNRIGSFKQPLYVSVCFAAWSSRTSRTSRTSGAPGPPRPPPASAAGADPGAAAQTERWQLTQTHRLIKHHTALCSRARLTVSTCFQALC